MVPNTAYVDIAKLNGNLSNLAAGDTTTSVWAQQTLQNAVIGQFGVPSLRHEPPRRFRITGNNIRPGAKLKLEMAKGGPPTNPPETEALEMDLYPVQLSHGLLAWETLVELDPLHTFALLNGGYFAPSVADVLMRADSTPTLDPTTWNFYRITVENEDGTSATNPTWQRLTIQDVR
jgi:hypothetical protein